MKRYWLFYGWYDDYDCPGANGGLSDFHGSFDSIEGAYVDFAMAKNYYNEPACWCQILDSDTSEIVKLQGFGETDRDLTHLRQHFKCPEIETQSPDQVSQWIDAEIYQSEIRAQKDDIPGEWVKPDNFGLLHDPSLCLSTQCECHTVEAKRVATPFPIEAGNPYCCNKCALHRSFALNFAPPYEPIPLVARTKFIPANGQKLVRPKFSLKDFIVGFFNKHL